MTTPSHTQHQHLTMREEPNAAFWLHMHTPYSMEKSGGRDCFTPEMLAEMREVMSGISKQVSGMAKPDRTHPVPHLVLCSDADVFNLGGDLDYFAQCIKNQDRECLLRYARECVHGVHDLYTGFGIGLQTIALVQGRALGGGFEAALGCQTLVAERGVEMGLPEVMFDLFPGMGAYSFLSRRVSARQAERIILGGEIYTSEKLFDMGVIDVLAEPGQGAQVVRDIIKKNQRIPNAIHAMQQVRAHVQDLSLEELMRITEVWVDTAMELPPKSLRTMRHLIGAQRRRSPGAIVELVAANG